LPDRVLESQDGIW